MLLSLFFCSTYNLDLIFKSLKNNSNKNQIHRTHQINGALMHIKQIFEDFKSSKLKNQHLIKELHLNCLMYLPNVNIFSNFIMKKLVNFN
jgi:hypothetical protein